MRSNHYSAWPMVMLAVLLLAWVDQAAGQVPAVVSEPVWSVDPAGPITMVCLGDSVTGVYYHTGGQRAYPEMLEIGLKRQFPKSMVTVINAGISGNTTADGLARLDADVLRHNPQLVTISFGLNDMNRLSEQEFTENLKRLVARCQTHPTRVVLCTPNAIISSQPEMRTKLVRYCEQIRAVAAQAQVPLCDQFATGERRRDSAPWDWRLTMSDAIHPNLAGHRAMAEELCRVITGQAISLADVSPPPAPLSFTLAKLARREPVRILAIPPCDDWIVSACRHWFPQATIELLPTPSEFHSVQELEQWCKDHVRRQQPDLVILTLPESALPAVSTAEDADFAYGWAWTMNWSLSFGRQEWDCLVVHPSVINPTLNKSPYADLLRTLVRAQDLHLIDRSGDPTTPGADIVRQAIRSWIPAHRLQE